MSFIRVCYFEIIVPGRLRHSTVRYRSNWLRIVGEVIFFPNLVFFIMICIIISLRFKWNPGSFSKSFISPSESLYIPARVSFFSIKFSCILI